MTLNRVRPKSEESFNLDLLGEISRNFSGAEIEQVIIESMRIGFNAGREFNNEDVLVAANNLVPLAKTKSKEIEELKSWATLGNVISASKK